VISAVVFVALWIWSYADKKEYEAFIARDFVVDEAARNFERGCFTFFFILMTAYAALATWYSCKAIKTVDSNSSW